MSVWEIDMVIGKHVSMFRSLFLYLSLSISLYHPSILSVSLAPSPCIFIILLRCILNFLVASLHGFLAWFDFLQSSHNRHPIARPWGCLFWANVLFMFSQCHHNAECNGPLARYVKLRVVHAPGTFSPATAGQRSRHASRHVRHARALMHVGIASQQFPLKSEAGKTFPAFPAHAQPAIVRIW